MRSRHVCRILVENVVLDFTFPYDRRGEMLPCSYANPVSFLSQRHSCMDTPTTLTVLSHLILTCREHV